MNFRQGVVIIDYRKDTLTGRSNRQRLWDRPIQWPLASFSQAFWFTLPGLKEAQSVIEKWRVSYSAKRPHSALDYRPPAPVVDGRGADLVGDEIAC